MYHISIDRKVLNHMIDLVNTLSNYYFIADNANCIKSMFIFQTSATIVL